MIVNNQLKGICKEAVIAWFGVVSRKLAGQTEENQENLTQDGRPLGQVWTQVFPNTKQDCCPLDLDVRFWEGEEKEEVFLCAVARQ
jgi:hypothetical protein